MEHLCRNLTISDPDIKRKIWTVFEESIRKTELMKDRDLDQLLMCAIYVICKVSNDHQRNFTDIMKSYRVQPQATSYIYRNVLLRNKRSEEELGTRVFIIICSLFIYFLIIIY